MHQDPATPPAQPRPAETPLGQVVAAIIAILIAMLEDHARANPGLAGLIALTIKRLEALPAKLDAMVAAHQSHTPTTHRRAQFSAPRPRTPGLPEQSSHTQRHSDANASLRRRVAMWTPSAPRAPPMP